MNDYTLEDILNEIKLDEGYEELNEASVIGAMLKTLGQRATAAPSALVKGVKAIAQKATSSVKQAADEFSQQVKANLKDEQESEYVAMTQTLRGQTTQFLMKLLDQVHKTAMTHAKKNGHPSPEFTAYGAVLSSVSAINMACDAYMKRNTPQQMQTLSQDAIAHQKGQTSIGNQQKAKRSSNQLSRTGATPPVNDPNAQTMGPNSIPKQTPPVSSTQRAGVDQTRTNTALPLQNPKKKTGPRGTLMMTRLSSKERDEPLQKP